ncbi:Hypothetical predicted protein [Mytilus galloprovincialis]|uniref:Uncharacterized protein n=1 Tax=Mytilus galloprovincialis TaxID=29158 RepID=A0A8B6CUC7_MYTGA|nr:Hypothetical predicted protein [Mytilus galloprovincialis]
MVQRELRRSYWNYNENIVTPKEENNQYSSMKRFWTYIKHQKSESSFQTSILIKFSSVKSVANHIPHKTAKQKDSLPWLTPSLRKLIKRRDRLYKKHKKLADLTKTSKLKETKRMAQRELRRSYWNYNENIVTPKEENNQYSSMKRFWTYIKHQKTESSFQTSILIKFSSVKNDREKLADFVNCFQETYKHLVDLELTHLNDGNYDNVPLVASCEFVKYIVSIASIVISKIKDKSCDIDDICMFVKLVIHFFECLYDPYFIWRKRIKGWSMDKNRMKYKPANLHVEVVPFFFDCFDRGHLPFDLRIRLLHMFGAIMCGSQNNALKVITPATLEVLLKMLSADHVTGPTNELRQELFCIKDLVLKCIICMVHVINLASIDQRQVEVSHVMEDYIKILLKKEDEPQDEQETHIQLAMIGAINEMLSCQDKSSLQVIMVSGGTFDAFISLLQKTAVSLPNIVKREDIWGMFRKCE